MRKAQDPERSSICNAPDESQPSRGRIRRFNARQRKKFAVGEFQQLMFEVRIRFVPGCDPASAESFLDAFLQVLESRSLAAGACVNDEMLDALVVARPRSTPSEADRSAIGTWISEQDNVATFAVGELIDANYASPPLSSARKSTPGAQDEDPFGPDRQDGYGTPRARMERIAAIPDRVRVYFKHEHVQYAQ